MLVTKDLINKNKSVYICDRCKIKLNVNNRNAIYSLEHNKKNKKMCDLCDKCYAKLKRGVGIKQIGKKE